MAEEPENLIFHLLRDMRADRASDMRMIADAVARVNRSNEGVNRVLDRLDELRSDLAEFRAEFVAFRGDADRNARRLEGDVATLEGRGYDRQAEAIEVGIRVVKLEAELKAVQTEMSSRMAAFATAPHEDR